MSGKTRKIITAAFAVAAVVCAGIGIHKYIQEQTAGDVYEEIEEEVKDETEESESEDPAEEESTVVIPIDFGTLTAQNPEIYAWITVAGTVIDYPVVQSAEDNSYYLTHSAYKEEAVEGAIFTENYNSTDFQDPNTVIYGHDMKNGSMFQNLLSYEDKTFFDSNRDIVIYTPDAIRHYKIFAAYPYDDRNILLSFDFNVESVYQAYLDSIYATRNMHAQIDTATVVTTDDKIITLSTCYGSQPDKRFLVQAVLTSVEQ